MRIWDVLRRRKVTISMTRTRMFMLTTLLVRDLLLVFELTSFFGGEGEGALPPNLGPF